MDGSVPVEMCSPQFMEQAAVQISENRRVQAASINPEEASLSRNLFEKHSSLNKAWDELFSYLIHYEGRLRIKEARVESECRMVRFQQEQLNSHQLPQEIDNLKKQLEGKEKLLSQCQAELINTTDNMKILQKDLAITKEFLEKAQQDKIISDEKYVTKQAEVERLALDIKLQQEEACIKDVMIQKIEAQMRTEVNENSSEIKSLKSLVETLNENLERERNAHHETRRRMRELVMNTSSVYDGYRYGSTTANLFPSTVVDIEQEEIHDERDEILLNFDRNSSRTDSAVRDSISRYLSRPGRFHLQSPTGRTCQPSATATNSTETSSMSQSQSDQSMVNPYSASQNPELREAEREGTTSPLPFHSNESDKSTTQSMPVGDNFATPRQNEGLAISNQNCSSNRSYSYDQNCLGGTALFSAFLPKLEMKEPKKKKKPGPKPGTKYGPRRPLKVKCSRLKKNKPMHWKTKQAMIRKMGEEAFLSSLKHEKVPENLEGILNSDTPKNRLCKPKCCHICQAEFPSIKAFLSHFTEYHPSDKPYPCDHCALSFTTQNNLLLHIHRIHGAPLVQSQAH